MRTQLSLLSVLSTLVLGACVVDEPPPDTEAVEAALSGTRYYSCYDERGCVESRRPDPAAQLSVACGEKSCVITSEKGERAEVEHDQARGDALAMIADWREARQLDNTYPWGGGPHPYFYDATCVWANQVDLIPAGGACPDTGGPLDPPTCGTGGPCPPEPDCDISTWACTMCTIEFAARFSWCAATGPINFPGCVYNAAIEFEDCVQQDCEC